jgi:hypothetical protein
MLVSEIPDRINLESEYSFTTGLAGVRIADDGIHIDDEVFSLDESTTRSLGSLLDISYNYLKKCPSELLASNVNYWLREKSEAEALVHVINGAPRLLKSNTKFIPVKSVVEMIGRLFEPNDEVVELTTTDQLVHVDVISNEQRIEVPGRDMPLRPENDVTHGGIRFRIVTDFRARPPEVYTYLNRRVCTNGLCIADPQHKLTLQGHTVDDVLREMESAANDLWGKLPDALEKYRSTADIEVPGEVAHFIHAVAEEHGVGFRVTSEAINRVGELPDPPSLYDVINLLTSIANEDVTYKTRESLQFLGGSIASKPEAYSHRCASCQHLL